MNSIEFFKIRYKIFPFTAASSIIDTPPYVESSYAISNHEIVFDKIKRNLDEEIIFPDFLLNRLLKERKNSSFKFTYRIFVDLRNSDVF